MLGQCGVFGVYPSCTARSGDCPQAKRCLGILLNVIFFFHDGGLLFYFPAFIHSQFLKWLFLYSIQNLQLCSAERSAQCKIYLYHWK